MLDVTKEMLNAMIKEQDDYLSWLDTVLKERWPHLSTYPATLDKQQRIERQMVEESRNVINSHMRGLSLRCILLPSIGDKN